MYEGTSTEQKAKNAKNRLNSMFNLFFIPSVSLRSTAPLTIRGAIYILFWRVSAHFIDSLKAVNSKRSLLLLLLAFCFLFCCVGFVGAVLFGCLLVTLFGSCCLCCGWLWLFVSADCTVVLLAVYRTG